MKRLAWAAAIGLLVAAMSISVDPAGRETAIRTTVWYLVGVGATALAVLGYRRFTSPDPGPFEPGRPARSPLTVPAEMETLRSELLGFDPAAPRISTGVRRRLADVAAARLRANHRCELDDPRAAALLTPALWAAITPGRQPAPGPDAAPAALIEALEQL